MWGGGRGGEGGGALGEFTEVRGQGSKTVFCRITNI